MEKLMSRKLITISTIMTLMSTSVIADVPNVAADIAPIHSLVSIVMDGVGAPKLIVQPGASPHGYRLRPSEAKALQDADHVFWIGEELTPWLDSAIDTLATKASVTTLLDQEGVILHDFREGALFEAHDHSAHGDDDHDDHDDQDDHDEHDDHDDHAGHDHGAFDPHAWQSLENAVIYANNIAAGLAQADPENAGDYYANRAAFITEVETLRADIGAMMKSLPADKRTVVTPHDAFGYFAATYDLTFVAPQGMSTDSEVSAADVAALITQIREESISAVFIESITDNRMMQQIANETGATIGGTLYSDALSAQSGPASTYLDMMRHNATTLFDALGN